MDNDTKQRFLRLLDLSLRAPSLPSKLIASFLKRIGRQCVNGVVTQPTDTLFCLSLIANLIKRHPRCVRLVTRDRNSLSLGIKMNDDPFMAEQVDPLKSRALKSSLWEVEILMK
jgi:U3 small nucleolar RNA-associated protein 19